MKNKKIIFVSIAIAVIVSLYSCNHQRRIAGNYTYTTECLGVELDGSQTLKAWGKGRNRTDAIEQAYKNAVRDVIFKGISKGNSECNMKPIVFEVNAQEKYEDYFNKFFADGGAYKEFVSEKDGSKYHIDVIKERKKAESQATYGIVVRVLRAELIAKMKKDGILKLN